MQEQLNIKFLKKVNAPVYLDGKRIVYCKWCRKVASYEEFVSYGGKGHVNSGVCKDCSSSLPIQTQVLRMP